MNPNPPPPPPPPSQPPPYGQPPYGQPLETTTWWQRNKKWAIPVGCVGLFFIVLCCGAGGFFIWGAGKGIQGFTQIAGAMQGIHAEAIAKVQDHPAVKEAVGEPVSVGQPGSPNMRIDNGRQEYRFEIPVSGPKGQATVAGHASSPDTKQPMTLKELTLETNDGSVDLLE